MPPRGRRVQAGDEHLVQRQRWRQASLGKEEGATALSGGVKQMAIMVCGPMASHDTPIELTFLVCIWPRPMRHPRSPLVLTSHAHLGPNDCLPPSVPAVRTVLEKQ